MSDSNQPVAFNGINATTGSYGLELSEQQLADLIFGHASVDELRHQKAKYTDAVRSARKSTSRGVKEGVDGTDLSQAGWGVIFAHADPRVDAIQEALHPLLTLRQTQAAHLFRIFTGLDAYRPHESKIDFLRRFNVGTGAVDPGKGVPYYLLLIGSPELIPYEFQYQLDVQFGVGRLDFDTLEEYERYAYSVVAAETGQLQLERTATFFSVTHEDDSATNSTNRFLVQPLANYLTPRSPEWVIQTVEGDDATRSALESLLGGNQKPALLFTASHGIEFLKGDPIQEGQQGALLCQEWPGPRQWPRGQALPEEFYFAGDHLADSAEPKGIVAFHFACYGGGTPDYYDFARKESRARYPIAERPFVARLPKKLLGHPKGGALAVVSHVDRAWSYSFKQGETSQTAVFESTLERLLQNQPLGWALEYFNNRYAELASDLNTEIDRMGWGTRLEPFELARLWTENNDARNYVILGDPAVRLAVAPDACRALTTTSVAVQRLADGRPATVPLDAWQQTPLVVQNALIQALDQVDVLAARLKEAEQAPASSVRRSPFRDGGQSREDTFRPATGRGGTTRGSAFRRGTTRGGQPRSGTTRSFNPRSSDEDSDH